MHQASPPETHPSRHGARRAGGPRPPASRTLVKLGYTDVWNLEGGMIAWEGSGYALTHRRR